MLLSRCSVPIESVRVDEQCSAVQNVHKDRNLDLVGWYTVVPSSGPSPVVLDIHEQILGKYNESALLLGFHQDEVLSHSVGGKLPLTIYESYWEVDDARTAAAADDEDESMADGEPRLRLKFREVPYSVETDETEMISMNYIAGGGGSATATSTVATTITTSTTTEDRPSRSVESNGKGKRRLVEPEDEETCDYSEYNGSVPLSRAEDEMIAALTTKANAVKMLQSRIQLLTAYLERLPPSFQVEGSITAEEVQDAGEIVPSLVVLRRIQALVSRLSLATPSDKVAYEKEMLREQNDVNLVGLLDGIMQSINEARIVGKKFHVVESVKKAIRHAEFTPVASSLGAPAVGASRI